MYKNIPINLLLILFKIVDTPGFDDSDGSENELIEEMMGILNDELGYTNIIVLALDGNTPRFTSGLQKMLRTVSAIFGQVWWDYMMIGVTKWKYSQDAIDEREENCEEVGADSLYCESEENFIKEWTRQLNEKFEFNKTFSFAFMDSFSQSENKSLHDEVQQFHWREETSKLWLESTRSNTTLEFKTIDEVLEENQVCKEENQRLHDIIDQAIADLNEKVEKNEGSISSVASIVAMNTKNIDSNGNTISNNTRNINTVSSRLDVISDKLVAVTNELPLINGKINTNMQDIDDLENTGLYK